MLKRRLICCLNLQNDLLVQSIGFQRFLPIGKAQIAVEFMTNWDIDEIILTDMTASVEGRKPNTNLISKISKNCFVPLTVGGGISSVPDIQKVIRAGADKVSINSTAITNPRLITQGADSFGSQCMVVSIDVKTTPSGGYEVYSHLKKSPTGKHPVEWAQEAEALGAGEIFLNSVDRDGSKQGYDLKLVKTVSEAVQIPVIACGGVGGMKHFVEGFTIGGASAVAAANIFQYIEHSAIVAKAYLLQEGIDVRLDTVAQYKGFQFDDYGRVLKKSDGELEQIWFEKFNVEKI